MTLDIEVSGRSRRVELDRVGSGWRASVDGRVLWVDAAPIASGLSLLIGPPEGGPHDDGPPEGRPHHDSVGSGFSRTSYEVMIDDRRESGMTVHLGGHAIDVRVIDPRVYRRRRAETTAGPSGVHHLHAPMPGRVLKVLVQVGERVSARQGLVVVEAMKMENELRAPGDGIVREVRTSAGATVEAGAILVVLE
jgi:biotin carboxyl carrier protein